MSAESRPAQRHRRAEDLAAATLLPVDPLRYGNAQTALPAIAKDRKLIAAIEDAVRQLPTRHRLHNADARNLGFLAPAAVRHYSLTRTRQMDGQRTQGKVRD